MLATVKSVLSYLTPVFLLDHDRSGAVCEVGVFASSTVRLHSDCRNTLKSARPRVHCGPSFAWVTLTPPVPLSVVGTSKKFDVNIGPPRVSARLPSVVGIRRLEIPFRFLKIRLAGSVISSGIGAKHARVCRKRRVLLPVPSCSFGPVLFDVFTLDSIGVAALIMLNLNGSRLLERAKITFAAARSLSYANAAARRS